MQSKLEAVKKVARSFKDHLAGILTLFKHGFCNASYRRLALHLQRAHAGRTQSPAGYAAKRAEPEE